MERLERNGDEGEYPDEDTAALDTIAFIISRVRLEEREAIDSGNTRGHDNAEVDPVTTGRQPWQKRREKRLEPGKNDKDLKNQGDLDKKQGRNLQEIMQDGENEMNKGNKERKDRRSQKSHLRDADFVSQDCGEC